jgi:hypothetical protein
MSKLSKKVRAQGIDLANLAEHVDYLERVGRQELARIAQSNAAASAVPQSTTTPPTPVAAPTATLSTADVTWLARVLRNGARVSNGAVSITLSAADARTIAARLDRASNGHTFGNLARQVS